MSSIEKILLQYKNVVQPELNSILEWWMKFMVDEKNGGFYASVNNENIPVENEAKGIVLNSRICWAFSAAYLQNNKTEYLQIAKRAFEYIKEFFVDKEYGGVFWSVNEHGEMQDGRKQIYGIAFTIYAFAEYFKASKNEEALTIAKNLFAVIERYSFDKNKTGYLEALSRDWSIADDLRLSEKDDNEKKTMNTHLHVIEAYANLYTVWKDEGLKNEIILLLNNFDDYIINHQNFHLNLFMDEDWNVHSTLVSYGHDIEAAWLLQECAEIISDSSQIKKYKDYSIKLTDAALEGWDEKHNGLWYEYEPATNHWLKEKHWWPQAEAMVGFLNAYQLTQNEKYLDYSISALNFIKENLKDANHGEWFWGIEENKKIMDKEKAGFWKCPYHNTRACLEIIKRVQSVIQ